MPWAGGVETQRRAHRGKELKEQSSLVGTWAGGQGAGLGRNLERVSKRAFSGLEAMG